MIKKYFIYLLIVKTIFISFSCGDDSNTVIPPPPQEKTKIKPVTNLTAYSLSNTAVVVKWTKSQDENLTDFDGYLVRILNNNIVVRERTVNKSLDSLEATDLIAGIIYTFEVVAKAQSNSTKYKNSDTLAIQWAPAWRLNFEGTIPIRVYESSSSTGFASGLIFFNTSNQQPKTVSLLSADSSLIDVYLFTVLNSSNVELRSSHLYRSNRKITRFSTVSRDFNSLNDPVPAPPDTTTYTKFDWRIDSVAVTSSKILFFKGNNGNYGRILIERNPSNGTLIWGTSPEQYIQVRLSYQPVPYVRFSKIK